MGHRVYNSKLLENKIMIAVNLTNLDDIGDIHILRADF